MLDVQLRRIVPKAAGTYFIVRDNSQVEEIEDENKMRLFFINVEQGPINMAISFAQGDTDGFKSVFGRGNRQMLRKGNFSIKTCLDALEAGPITVVNLRAFDDTKDKCEVTGFNPNALQILGQKIKSTPYRKLFNTNTFWTPNYDKMNGIVENSVLNFANVGNAPISIFVTFSNYVDLVTSEGDKSLANCSLEIDEYPALDFDMLLKDTIVDVYLFNNTFDPETVSTNKYYGDCFSPEGNLVLEKIEKLCGIPEAGFVKVFTGSLIPNLKNEQSVDISINNVINQYFMETGLICDINDDMFENEYKIPFIDATGFSFFDEDGKRTIGSIGESVTVLSHIVPEKLTIDDDGCDIESQAGYIKCEKIEIEPNSFKTTYGSGIRYGNSILGRDRVVNVIEIELCEDVEELTADTIIKVTCDGVVKFSSLENDEENNDEEKFIPNAMILKYNSIFRKGMLTITNLNAYIPRPEQFLIDSSVRQKEILDLINNPGIVKGLCGIRGLRYVVDCFKSYPESSYKSQFGQLMATLDEKNRFVRFIGNDVFIEDLQKSFNPSFKDALGNFNLEYLQDGGNKDVSTKLLTKFSTGAEYCFFFGPEEKVNNIPVGLAGKISNLFYQKSIDYDVLANTTGIVDGIEELGYPFDDDDRKYCEKFRYNPIIYLRNAYRIYGNLTAKAEKTAQQQITNSELLAYIKQNLYNISMTENFKRGTYDDYLRTETQCKEFMSSLAIAGVIDADFICECNSSNNTLEIRKQKIKLVHIEYTPVDVLEKVVFDLTIN